MPAAVMAMVQGPMLLSAALPHHGPPPTKEQQDQMAQAGQLLYKAYAILQNADQSIGATHEQMKFSSGGKGNTAVASGIADAERMVKTAKEKLKQGEDLSRKARNSFMNNANPLGDPPQSPHEWDSVDAMGQRARAKLTSINEELHETKHLAREQGINVDITVASEKAFVIEDAYGAQKDNEILAFMNGY